MSTILLRIFFVYSLVHSFLVCLVPKKVRAFLPHSWFGATTASPSPSSSVILIPNRMTMNRSELKRVFQLFDHNGDGRISKQELNDSLESLGIFIPDKELTLMIEKVDVNGDGCVDIEEFGELYQSIMGERNEDEDLQNAFNVFDQNGDGFITIEELRMVLSSLGLKQESAMDNCKKMIMNVDADGNGMVDYKEFQQMMKGGGFTALS